MGNHCHLFAMLYFYRSSPGKWVLIAIFFILFSFSFMLHYLVIITIHHLHLSLIHQFGVWLLSSIYKYPNFLSKYVAQKWGLCVCVHARAFEFICEWWSIMVQKKIGMGAQERHKGVTVKTNFKYHSGSLIKIQVILSMIYGNRCICYP